VGNRNNSIGKSGEHNLCVEASTLLQRCRGGRKVCGGDSAAAGGVCADAAAAEHWSGSLEFPDACNTWHAGMHKAPVPRTCDEGLRGSSAGHVAQGEQHPVLFRQGRGCIDHLAFQGCNHVLRGLY
jgi:hypothetical protein